MIAAATRALKPNLSWHQMQKAKRETLEKDLTFLGLIVMRNALKPETSPVIHKLHNAAIRTIMITGTACNHAI